MSKIYVWGTGQLAKRLIKNQVNSEIIGFIETNKKDAVFENKKVYKYTEIKDDYDAIVVANNYSNEVYLSAKDAGINLEKMIFIRPCSYLRSEDNFEWIKSILGGKNFELYLGEHGFYEKTFFERDKQQYQLLNKRKNFDIDESCLWPIIRDKYENAGIVDNYFWQDLWAAKLIHANIPKEHYDIGSRLDGFIAHVLAFGIPVKMIDIRPFPVEVEGLTTVVDDATNLTCFPDNSIESLSALCSLEHFGLGRYGDPIDPDACFKCFQKIQEKMKIGGKLYIALPIGRERVEFNAHRVFYPQTIVDCFDKMQLVEFSCTADGKIEKDVDLHKYDQDKHNGNYRYGLFYFVKK